MTSKLNDTTGTKKVGQVKTTKTINISHTRKGGSSHSKSIFERLIVYNNLN